LEGIERSVSAPVPQFAAPISGAGEESIIEEGVGTHLVNRTVVPRVYLQVLLGIALGAAVDYSFFSGGEVHRGLSLQELEGKTACKSKIHVLSCILLT
jgi:hypothetical protein